MRCVVQLYLASLKTDTFQPVTRHREDHFRM